MLVPHMAFLFFSLFYCSEWSWYHSDLVDWGLQDILCLLNSTYKLQGYALLLKFLMIEEGARAVVGLGVTVVDEIAGLLLGTGASVDFPPSFLQLSIWLQRRQTFERFILIKIKNVSEFKIQNLPSNNSV